MNARATAALPITLCGEPLVLLAARALYWERHASLLVADLHLGKEGALRTAQVFVPEGPTQETLARLDGCLGGLGARKLIILGDLFHNRHALTTAGREFLHWRLNRPHLEIVLIPGSHDRWTGGLPDSWDITVSPEVFLHPPFAYRHYPEPTHNFYTLSGHLHPGVVLKGPGAESLRLPCFYFGSRVGMLPAFGEFTGIVPVKPEAGDGLYAVADNYVVTVQPLADQSPQVKNKKHFMRS
jgi:DNA ligase-associated metallophosphoesterase